MTFVSYAQNFEDVLLWRALGAVADGFYIDVGASFPDVDSVTRAFYDRGWRGINVEPTQAAFQRLVAARPRDVTLNLAIAPEAGTSVFYAGEDVNSGLSSLDEGVQDRYAALGIGVRRTEVRTETLAAVCAAHAAETIHFLKVDVEGAERAVLASADFTRFRPWIVLAEATAPMSTEETHAAWEPILLEAGYRFVWFDGLNRFYVAAERFEQLAPAFRTPPNVFDDFLRANDTEWTRRITAAETRAAALEQHVRQAEAREAASRDQVRRAEFRAAVAEDRSEAAHLQLARRGVDAVRAAGLAEMRAGVIAGLEAEAAALRDERALLMLHVEHGTALGARAERLQAEHAALEARLAAVHRSTSWRVTSPLRRLRGWRGPVAVPPPAPPLAPHPAPPLPGAPAVARPEAGAPPSPPRAVHQFHSGTAFGDAITNAMFLTQRVLRGLGYDSRIFAEHLDPALGGRIHSLHDLPRDGGYVLIVRHSMGHGALGHILALPVRKILIYHNITPPEFLDGAFLQEHARLGRAQLAQLRPAVAAGLADSEYNAIELRRLGFRGVAACTLLFDLRDMAAEWRARAPGPVLRILFVGRVAAAKGQTALVEAFARFRAQYAGESQLVLVGRNSGDDYGRELLALVHRHGLGHGEVHLAGLVSDDELRRHYAEADLFVSLSRHEGFGVPLVEAIARGIPVLAVAAGAMPYTIGDAAGLLQDGTPDAAAAAMLALAQDPAARQALAARQHASVRRFALEAQVPALVQALALAGAADPVRATDRATLVAQACFTVAGHVNGSYSLAEINRALALSLEAERPGSVRLLAVEGDVTAAVPGIPPGQRGMVGRLLARGAPASGPHVVISQHYPVWVPPEPGDVALALFFWEESLVPAETVAVLNAGFAGVVAPTRTVARALLDSGVQVPVRVVPLLPRLDDFVELRARRAARESGLFTFLHVSSCFPRKGVDVLLAAWARAFGRGAAVRLVIKGFPNPHNTVAADLARVRAAHPDMAAVELIDRDMGAEELLALYGQADAVVLPTRGEGFNLPAMEAATAGIPVITTGWGGHLDFLAPGPGVRLLRYRLAPSGSHLATPFSLWAAPDEADLVAALRETVAAGRVVAPAPAVSSAVAAGLGGFAADLLLAGPPAAPRVGWVTTWDVKCGIAEYARHLVPAVGLPGPVFADRRTPEGTGVLPVWTAGQDVEALMAAVLRQDPEVVVIQHQPGLFPWSMLPGLLLHPALEARVVCLTLHNTQDLVDAAPDVIGAAVAAMARMSRVAVHTVRDMNTLAGLGLDGNTVLIPQGTAPSAGAVAARALGPEDDVLIGSYGFFLPGKGIPQLIQALALLRRDWPRARLRLVNAEYPLPPSAEEIEACVGLARRLGLEAAVEFRTGFLPHADSTALLRQCDVVVLPYQASKEGSSAALRSVLASGVPLAVTPLPLFEEAAGAALPLPGTTPEAIAAGLDAGLRDRAGRAAAVAAAVAWLEARSWDGVGRRWRGMLGALHRSGVVVPPS